MSPRRFLLAMLLCLACVPRVSAQPRGVDNIALTKVPAVVVVVSSSKDPRVPLVRSGVAHWNQLLAGIGSGFRMGAVTLGNASISGEPGKIVVVLSDEEFISHVRRLPRGRARWR